MNVKPSHVTGKKKEKELVMAFSWKLYKQDLPLSFIVNSVALPLRVQQHHEHAFNNWHIASCSYKTRFNKMLLPFLGDFKWAVSGIALW